MQIKQFIVFIFLFGSIVKTSVALGQGGFVANDSLIISKLLDKANFHYDFKRNTDSIISYSRKAKDLSKRYKVSALLGKSFWHLGRAHLLQNTLDSSFYYINKSKVLGEETKNIKLVNDSKLLLARYHEKKNDLTKATALALEVIKTAETNKDDALLVRAYYKLASTYALHDDNEMYKVYLDKAYKLMTEKDINIPVSVRSGIYTYLVDYFEQKRYQNPENQQNIDSIFYYANAGIAYTRSINKSSSLVYLLGIKGKMYFLKDELAKAKDMYNEALTFRNDLDKFHLRGLYLKLAYVHLKNNDNKTALVYKDSILMDINEEPSYYRKAERYKVAYAISKTANELDLALEYHEKMSENLLKAKDEKQIHALNELQIKYETEKKDAEIAKQKLHNETIKNKARTNYLIIGIIAVIGFSILSMFYLKRKNKILVTELDLATTKATLHRAQINPHFISNSINAIYPFLYDKSDPNKAAAYLSDLSQMIRSILDSTFETTWSIKEELNFIKQYCKIQELKMNFPLKLNIDSDPSLHTLVIPSLLLQPFVENSFVHGFVETQNNAKITIELERNNKFILIQIIDNGEAQNTPVKNRVSRSTEITKQRILSMYENTLLAEDFLNSENNSNKGYQVTIKLPYIS